MLVLLLWLDYVAALCVCCLHFSICACHPCAGAMLIFYVSLQFEQMLPEGNPSLRPSLAFAMDWESWSPPQHCRMPYEPPPQWLWHPPPPPRAVVHQSPPDDPTTFLRNPATWSRYPEPPAAEIFHGDLFWAAPPGKDRNPNTRTRAFAGLRFESFKRMHISGQYFKTNSKTHISTQVPAGLLFYYQAYILCYVIWLIIKLHIYILYVF